MPSACPGKLTANVFAVRCLKTDGKEALYRNLQCRPCLPSAADGKDLCHPLSGPLPSAMADGKSADSCSVPHKFNFSKFNRQTHDKDLSNKDDINGLASIAVPPADPLEQYLLDHENDMHMNERNEIDEIFFRRAPILMNIICLLKFWEILFHLRVIRCLN